MFQACVVVNVKTGGMLSRRMVSLSQRLSRSSALTSASSLVHVGRALLFSFSLVIALSAVTS